jgi:hypothetical protein
MKYHIQRPWTDDRRMDTPTYCGLTGIFGTLGVIALKGRYYLRSTNQEVPAEKVCKKCIHNRGYS